MPAVLVTRATAMQNLFLPQNWPRPSLITSTHGRMARLNTPAKCYQSEQSDQSGSTLVNFKCLYNKHHCHYAKTDNNTGLKLFACSCRKLGLSRCNATESSDKTSVNVWLQSRKYSRRTTPLLGRISPSTHCIRRHLTSAARHSWHIIQNHHQSLSYGYSPKWNHKTKVKLNKMAMTSEVSLD